MHSGPQTRWQWFAERQRSSSSAGIDSVSLCWPTLYHRHKRLAEWLHGAGARLTLVVLSFFCSLGSGAIAAARPSSNASQPAVILVHGGTWSCEGLFGEGTGSKQPSVIVLPTKSATTDEVGATPATVLVGRESIVETLLQPGAGASHLAPLSIAGAVRFQADATHYYLLDSERAEAGTLVADGVTIEEGAQLQFSVIGRKRLKPGSVFPVITNTASSPTRGRFFNLPDNWTFTSGANRYHASY